MTAITNKRQLTKREWYDLGGFRNPSLYRKHNGRHWEYWQATDHHHRSTAQ